MSCCGGCRKLFHSPAKDSTCELEYGAVYAGYDDIRLRLLRKMPLQDYAPKGENNSLLVQWIWERYCGIFIISFAE